MSLATALTHFLQPFFLPSNSVFVIMWQVKENFIVHKHQHCGRPDREPLPSTSTILHTIDTPQGKMNGLPHYKWTVAFYTVRIIAHQFCRAWSEILDHRNRESNPISGKSMHRLEFKHLTI